MKLFLMNAAFVRFQAISDRGAIGGDCFSPAGLPIVRRGVRNGPDADIDPPPMDFVFWGNLNHRR
jgi:hypothetical protein